MQALFRRMKRNEVDAQLVFVGIDNAGKSTIVQRLAGEDITVIFPTKGYHIHVVPFKQSRVHISDLGGAAETRRHWKNYFVGKDAIVYVIDSVDRSRLEESGKALFEILGEERVSGLPLLILANKQDQLAAIDVEHIKAGLNLHSIRDRRWTMIGCSAVTGQGIEEGIDYLIREINHTRSPKSK